MKGDICCANPAYGTAYTWDGYDMSLWASARDVWN